MIIDDDILNAKFEDLDRIIDEHLKEQHTNDIDIRLEDKYIGYVDINGMTSLMEKTPDDQFQMLCNNIANVVNDIVDENDGYSMDGVEMEFHMFSDNMIFICNNLKVLIERMGLLQRKLIVQLGLSIKGGIDFGKIYYYKGRFILGKGLLSAYDIDKNYHHPAIKVANRIVDTDLDGLVLMVPDEEYIVDFYNIAAFSEDFYFEELPIIKDFIIANLNKGYTGGILDKYKWMKDYHNNFCKKNNCMDYAIND